MYVNIHMYNVSGRSDLNIIFHRINIDQIYSKVSFVRCTCTSRECSKNIWIHFTGL